MDILIEELEGSLWVAAIKDGRLEGLEVDPLMEEVRWGSIYWAKVKTIDAALDAAYVDLDGENTGILYNKDLRLPGPDGKIIKGGSKAIGKALQPGQMIAVQAKTAYMPKRDSDYLRSESKLAQVSMDITIPGRYLIYCVNVDDNQISQRIRGKKLREQLQAMLDSNPDIKNCILRAAGADMQTGMLIREGKILKEAWNQMQTYLTGDEPTLIMLGPDALQRSLSDNATQHIASIQIVTMDHFTHAEEWCSIFAPDLVPRLEPIPLKDASVDFALFEHRDIMGEIEQLSQPYIFLPGGGNIIIQQTAALTAIDVNRGSAKGSNLAINIEAAHEIARQIRLRNAGGIIIADFLKSHDAAENRKLAETLEHETLHDPCTVQIHGLTKLGLMEITRKRRTPSLQDRIGDLIG